MVDDGKRGTQKVLRLSRTYGSPPDQVDPYVYYFWYLLFLNLFSFFSFKLLIFLYGHFLFALVRWTMMSVMMVQKEGLGIWDLS